jgi:hypothetical protein
MERTWWKNNKQVTPNNNNVIVGKNAYQSGNISGGSMINGATIEATVIGIEEVMGYLSTKGCTLWGNWDISSEDGLQDAAEWLTTEIYNVLLFVSQEETE